MYTKEWIQTEGQPLLYTYGEMSNVLIGNYGTLYQLSNHLVDSTFWNSITKLNDMSTYINRIFIYPMYIRTPSSEGRSLKLLGAIDNFYSDVKVEPLYVSPPSDNIGVYTLFEKVINGKYDDFRDYGNYTKIKVYLPYLGFVDVDTNDVMNKWLKICLQVDFRTGYGLYYILVESEDNSLSEELNYRILSKHSVKLAIEVPVGSTSSAEQYRNMVLSAVRIASTIGFAVAGMPLSSTIMASSIASTTENVSEAKSRGDWKGSKMRPVSSSVERAVTEGTETKTYTHMRGSHAIATDITSSALSALNGSSSTTHSVQSNDAILEGVGCKYVKVVIERPIYGNVGNYYNLCGRPLQEVKQLNLLSGYTEISDVHLENFGDATYGELATLNSLLKSGIIL